MKMQNQCKSCSGISIYREIKSMSRFPTNHKYYPATQQIRFKRICVVTTAFSASKLYPVISW